MLWNTYYGIRGLYTTCRIFMKIRCSEVGFQYGIKLIKEDLFIIKLKQGDMNLAVRISGSHWTPPDPEEF